MRLLIVARLLQEDDRIHAGFCKGFQRNADLIRVADVASRFVTVWAIALKFIWWSRPDLREGPSLII